MLEMISDICEMVTGQSNQLKTSLKIDFDREGCTISSKSESFYYDWVDIAHLVRVHMPLILMVTRDGTEHVAVLKSVRGQKRKQRLEMMYRFWHERIPDAEQYEVFEQNHWRLKRIRKEGRKLIIAGVFGGIFFWSVCVVLLFVKPETVSNWKELWAWLSLFGFGLVDWILAIWGWWILRKNRIVSLSIAEGCLFVTMQNGEEKAYESGDVRKFDAKSAKLCLNDRTIRELCDYAYWPILRWKLFRFIRSEESMAEAVVVEE